MAIRTCVGGSVPMYVSESCPAPPTLATRPLMEGALAIPSAMGGRSSEAAWLKTSGGGEARVREFETRLKKPANEFKTWPGPWLVEGERRQ